MNTESAMHLQFLAAYCGQALEIDSNWKAHDFNTVLRATASKAGDKAKGFLGATAAEQASVSSWLSLSRGDCRNMECIKELNSHLKSRSFLASHTITLADVAIYLVLHDLVSKGGANTVSSLPHFCRWFDQLQHTVANINGAPLTVPGMLLPPPPIAVTAAPAKAAGGGKKDKGAATPKDKGTATPKDKGAPAAGAEKGKKGGKEGKDGGKKKGGGKPWVKGGEKGAAPAATSVIAGLELKVGLIVKAWKHETADKLYCEEIDVGEGAMRTIASGLANHIPEAEMQNRRVVVLCNMKPRNMLGFKSQGMVMCGMTKDQSTVELLEPPAGAKIGERITFPGHDGAPLSANQIQKQKTVEACMPDFNTKDDLIGYWKDAAFTTSAGPCTVKSIRSGIIG